VSPAKRSYRYFAGRLAYSRKQHFIAAERRWRLTMRELSAESGLHLHARSLSERTARRLHVAALYGAFAVIAAVLFGTLSYHPF
jgi:hypothetical protein